MHVAIAQEVRCGGARQVATPCQHGNRLTHPRADEFVCLLIQNDVIQRIGIAVENRRHHAVRRLRDRITDDRVEYLAGQPQECRQWPVRRLFAPLTEQMKDKKQRGPGSQRTFERQERIDAPQEYRNHRTAISLGGTDRLDRQSTRLA